MIEYGSGRFIGYFVERHQHWRSRRMARDDKLLWQWLRWHAPLGDRSLKRHDIFAHG